jgi:mannose-6-phosphate isomerase-like protein (cupin superfamily)
MRVGSERAEVAPGTLVYVPSDTEHAIRNDGSELLIYISATSPPFVFADPGETFAFEHGHTPLSP